MTTTHKKELGGRIASLLKEQRMTQKELAALAGATKSAISKYIKGEREPRAEVLANIATALQTTSAYLLGLEEGLETPFGTIKDLCARHASNMTEEQRNDLILTILSTRTEPKE